MSNSKDIIIFVYVQREDANIIIRDMFYGKVSNELENIKMVSLLGNFNA